MSICAVLRRIESAKLAEVRKKPRRTRALVENDEREDSLVLEYGYDTLQCLLAGALEGGHPSLRDVILGGVEIGPEIGYGPARFVEPVRVLEISRALESLRWEDVRSRGRSLPSSSLSAGAPGTDEEWEMIRQGFEQVRKLYGRAAVRGNAMMLYLA